MMLCLGTQNGEMRRHCLVMVCAARSDDVLHWGNEEGVVCSWCTLLNEMMLGLGAHEVEMRRV
eukprot:scaffold65283_cov18-Tisochrysis_lutea.AAC.2